MIPVWVKIKIERHRDWGKWAYNYTSQKNQHDAGLKSVWELLRIVALHQVKVGILSLSGAKKYVLVREHWSTYALRHILGYINSQRVRTKTDMDRAVTSGCQRSKEVAAIRNARHRFRSISPLAIPRYVTLQVSGITKVRAFKRLGIVLVQILAITNNIFARARAYFIDLINVKQNPSFLTIYTYF